MKLDRLIDDQETLTPAQKRWVRCRVTYRLEKLDSEQIHVLFKFPCEEKEIPLILNLKEKGDDINIYKFVMFGLIQHDMQSIKNETLLEEVSEFHEKHDYCFYKNGYVEVSAKKLYTILMRIHEDGYEQN